MTTAVSIDPPNDSMPELRLGDVPNLCSLGFRPHIMTGLLVQLLRQHFADRRNIATPSMRDETWRPGEDTGIVIESITNWNPNQAMTRPAIVVKRNAWQFERIGIGDRLMGSHEEDGSDYYCVLAHGSHTLFCLAGEPGEAEYLAAEVYPEMIQFGPVIRAQFLLHRFVLAELGGLMKVQEATDSHAVPITLAYVGEEAWRITPQAPYLKRITLSSILGSGA
jgi:hypothetical protein